MKDSVRFIKNRMFRIIDLLLFTVLKIVPRQDNLWVFGSGFGYADNSKYLFEELLNKHPEIKAVWITLRRQDAKVLRRKGKNAYWKHSIIGFFYASIAKVYIYTGRTNDIKFVTSGGALKFCLWHGVPMKEIEFLISRGPLTKRYDYSISSRIDFACCYQKPDVLLTIGIIGTKFLMEGMRVDESKCISNIYPRCKLFLESTEKQLDYIKNNQGVAYQLYNLTRGYHKVYVYMPTFRDAHPHYLSEMNFDFEELNNALSKSNSFFILKVHPNTLPILKKEYNYSNIYIVKQPFDIYPLLPFVSTLITDYSSIYFDFLYLRKEIILFPFDKERYSAEDRPFVIDYDKDIRGVRIYIFEELIDIIYSERDCSLSPDDYKEMIANYGSNKNIDLTEYIKHKINKKNYEKFS